VTALRDRLIRLAGGEPAAVRPLTRALRANARGQHALLRESTRRQTVMSAESLHVLGLVLAGLASVILVLVTVMLRGRGDPPVAAIALCGAHLLFLTTAVVGQIVPALLCDEDAGVLGWWPLTRRDVLLARLATVLIPALQTTLALTALPLLAFLFTGRSPVAAMLLLAFAILLQTLVVAFGTAVFTTGTARALGPRRARRLASLFVDNNISFMPFLLLPFGRTLVGWVRLHPGVLDWLPPVWFAAFAAPAAGPAALRGMALALSLCALVGVLGWRVASGGGGAPATAMRQTAKVHRHPADLLPWLLRPWMRDREGWVVSRLLAAHLREDWRFAGNLLMIVAVAAVMMWYATSLRHAGRDAAEALLLGGSQTLLMLIMALPYLSTYSSSPRALWIVALADLDPERLLAAQRGMVRGLAVVPILVVFGLRALSYGMDPGYVAVALALMASEAEVLLLIFQWFQPEMAFSREFTRDQSSQNIVRGFALAGVMVLATIVNLLAITYLPVRVALLAGIPLLFWFLRRRLARRVAGGRLNLAESAG
jgi:hypothetical protein